MPQLKAGQTVISDRYVASGLAIQRFDNVDPMFLWQLNEKAERPDLAVILEADPNVIIERLETRGPRNRFQTTPGSCHAEVDFYRQAQQTLQEAGFAVLAVDCSRRPPEQSARIIRGELVALQAHRDAVN